MGLASSMGLTSGDHSALLGRQVISENSLSGLYTFYQRFPNDVVAATAEDAI